MLLLLVVRVTDEVPYVLLVLPVAASAWYGGRAYGFLTSMLAIGLLLAAFSTAPLAPSGISDRDQVVRIVSTLIVSGAASIVVDWLHRSQRSLTSLATTRERLLIERDDLLRSVMASEERWHVLTDAVPALIAQASTAGGEVYYNHRMTEYTGRTAEELQGDGWLEIAHPDEIADLREQWQRALASGVRMEFEQRLRRADGVFRRHLVIGEPIRGQSGAITSWLSASVDIEDSRQAQDALAASEERYRTLTELLPANVSVLSSDGSIIYANERWQQYTGVPLSDAVGRARADFVHPNDLAEVDVSAAPLAAERKADVEFRLRRADGVFRWNRGARSAMRGPDGRIMSWISVSIDVHDERVARESLVRSEEQYRVLTDAMPAIVATIDLSGDTTYRNRAFYEYTGLNDDQALDWWNQGLVLRDDVLAVADEWAATTARGEPMVAELRIRRQDGEYRWHTVRAVPLGSRSRWLIAAIDIHDRKVATAALETVLVEKDQAVALHSAAEEQLTLLVEASSGLIESLQLDEMVPKILQISTRLIAADAYALWSMDAARTEWRILASDGLSRAYVENASVIPVTETVPSLTDVLAAEDIEADPRLADRLEGYAKESIKSLLVLPLSVGGENTGTLTFYYRHRHRFSAEDLRVSKALANLTASAIGLARLNEDEKRNRERLEAANRRLAILAEASTELASSMEYEQTLPIVAALTVDEVADSCVISLIDEDGEPVPAAIAHRDPAEVAKIQQLAERYPPRADSPYGLRDVIRTQRPKLIADISREALAGAAQDEEHLRLILERGPRSSLTVPMVARGVVLGAITFITTGDRAPLSREDLPFAEEFARGAAAAIDNARLFRDAERIAQDLREANTVKDEFLGMVSHELKTPITMILGGSEVLTNHGERVAPDDRAAALRDINESAMRLGQLIDNLLLLSRLEVGTTMDLEPILVRHEIERIVADYRKRVPDRSFNVAMHPAITPVSAEPTNFQQVLRNLMSNAIKYSPPGSPIDIVTHRDGAEFIVSVLDRGNGIPPEERELIFEPFFRSRRTSQSASGAGVGLAVCKRLVEAQGGRIWESPREGGGSNFSIALRVEEMELDDGDE